MFYITGKKAPILILGGKKHWNINIMKTPHCLAKNLSQKIYPDAHQETLSLKKK